ncbi:hypothetical protein NA56DRAFT_648753 [Hyaloscypha hepaticicola]|uniref:Uncharacterized protein n=1 Tax=Hyaloscypha hepaticicola TaxID=2082293 RepID=A0A2J6PTJ5_9HELO|nr:hypothetical protein NA56DRAFT_648753 [Hyaloscypha hepaticicola]
MPPIAPARFRFPLTPSRLPAPTVSEYSPHYGGDYDYLTLEKEVVAPTPAALLDRYASPQQNYVTLTITLPNELPYTTTILLGDTFPTSAAPTDPVQQSASSPTLSPAAIQNADSSNSGYIAGIIIGVLGGLAVLAGVFYVYTLRARQYLSSNKSVSGSRSTRRRRKKKKRRKGKKGSPWFKFDFKWRTTKKKGRSRRSSMSTAGTGPGPAPPPPGPAPPPPPPPAAPAE